ncbi:MAG: hypothetical protein ACWA5X_07060 [bacterium]
MSFCRDYDIEGGGHDPRQDIREEMARILEVAGAQIDMAMFDGFKAVEVLTGVMSELGSVSLALRGVLEGGESISRDDLEDYLTSLDKNTDLALKEFQFYDLLTQRIAHGVKSVDLLSKYLSSNKDAGCLENWKAFRDSINERFSLESEKRLFDLMMSGISTDKALDLLASQGDPKVEPDVELF